MDIGRGGWLLRVSERKYSFGTLQDADLPPPPEDPADGEIDECRLWIGNLDTRVTE